MNGGTKRLSWLDVSTIDSLVIKDYLPPDKLEALRRDDGER